MNRWICGPLPDSTARVRLFCYPHAGGGATSFLSWRPLLRRSDIDVCCVQLPGRETRFAEAPIKAMGELAVRISDGIKPYLNLPFSFFGHSMGAFVCFEVTRELQRRGSNLPEWLFMSAAVPPHRRPSETLHALPKGAFLDAVAQRFNGLARRVVADQDLLDVVAPILQADFELIERYRYETRQALPVKIVAFGGRGDNSVPPAELLRWSDLTTQPERFRAILFDGDHFFLNQQRAQLLAELALLLA
jgi:medium-chain acyl-[acyl-carrier-protein] hydrolase